MTLNRVDNTYLTLKVVTIGVVPKNPLVIRQTLLLLVVCHCTVLGYVYSDLSTKWLINDLLWKDYGTTLPIVVSKI